MKALIIHESKLSPEEHILIGRMKTILLASNVELSTDISTLATRDYIILFGFSRLPMLHKLNKLYDKTVICCLQNSDIVSNYACIDITKVDFFIFFSDRNTRVVFPYQKLSKTFSIPFQLTKKVGDRLSQPLPNPRIYVNLGKDILGEVSLKLIRVLNQLTQYNIVLQTNNKRLRRVLNENIEIALNDNIKVNVQLADIVIGAGYAISTAICEAKPCIVIGKKGYGGIVTIENIMEQNQCFFQGRIGGQYNEMIPEELVFEDIQNLINGYDSDREMYNELSLLSEEVESKIVRTINEVVRLKKGLINNLYNSSLIFNSDFTIIKGGNRYWVRNRYTKQIQGWIDEQSYNIVDMFIEENKISDALKNVQHIEQKKQLKFIKSLIRDKVLIPYIVINPDC